MVTLLDVEIMLTHLNLYYVVLIKFSMCNKQIFTDKVTDAPSYNQQNSLRLMNPLNEKHFGKLGMAGVKKN